MMAYIPFPVYYTSPSIIQTNITQTSRSYITQVHTGMQACQNPEQLYAIRKLYKNSQMMYHITHGIRTDKPEQNV